MLYKNQKASLTPKVLKLASPLPNGKPYISAKKPMDVALFFVETLKLDAISYAISSAISSKVGSK